MLHIVSKPFSSPGEVSGPYDDGLSGCTTPPSVPEVILTMPQGQDAQRVYEDDFLERPISYSMASIDVIMEILRDLILNAEPELLCQQDSTGVVPGAPTAVPGSLGIPRQLDTSTLQETNSAGIQEPTVGTEQLKAESQTKRTNSYALDSDLFLDVTAKPIKQTKEWQKSVSDELRSRVVLKIIEYIFPISSYEAFRDKRMKLLAAYAKKVEGDMFEMANSQPEFYHHLGEKIYKIQKELEEKLLMRKNSCPGGPEPDLDPYPTSVPSLAPVQTPPGIPSPKPSLAQSRALNLTSTVPVEALASVPALSSALEQALVPTLGSVPAGSLVESGKIITPTISKASIIDTPIVERGIFCLNNRTSSFVIGILSMIILCVFTLMMFVETFQWQEEENIRLICSHVVKITEVTLKDCQTIISWNLAIRSSATIGVSCGLLIINSLFIHGLRKNMPKLLLPYLISYGMCVLLVIINAALSLKNAFFPAATSVFLFNVALQTVLSFWLIHGFLIIGGCWMEMKLLQLKHVNDDKIFLEKGEVIVKTMKI